MVQIDFCDPESITYEDDYPLDKEWVYACRGYVIKDIPQMMAHTGPFNLPHGHPILTVVVAALFVGLVACFGYLGDRNDI